MGMIALLLAGFFISPIPLNQSVYEEVVSVRGAVIDDTNNQPIAGATVYASSETDFQTTTTDNKGNFYFLQLFPGVYRFSAVQSGYAECLCCSQPPPWLDAGLEYLATVHLARRCF